MAQTPIVLYSATTGLSTLVDAGDGMRQKSWLEEVSRWLKEAVEPTTLKGLGLGRLANFPTFLDGSELSSNPIGQAPVTSSFAGVEVSEVVPQSVVFAVADGSATAFGTEALTQPDPTHADYFNTTTDPDDPVAPRGAQAPAFLQTIVDAGGLDLSTTSGVLTVRVNGVLYSVSGLTGATTVVEDIRTAIIDAGWPVNTQIEGGDTLRIFAPGLGRTANIKAVAVTGDVATVLFTGSGQSSQPNVLYLGTGGPLGEMSNANSANGAKTQRRILPGSVVVTATVSGVTITLTDNKSGTLVPNTGAHTGTINYTTGAIALTFAAAPTNATNINAKWKALIPLDLTQPVRKRLGGLEMAIRAK